jgi:hypothetical protein
VNGEMHSEGKGLSECNFRPLRVVAFILSHVNLSIVHGRFIAKILKNEVLGGEFVDRNLVPSFV